MFFFNDKSEEPLKCSKTSCDPYLGQDLSIHVKKPYPSGDPVPLIFKNANDDMWLSRFGGVWLRAPLSLLLLHVHGLLAGWRDPRLTRISLPSTAWAGEAQRRETQAPQVGSQAAVVWYTLRWVQLQSYEDIEY